MPFYLPPRNDVDRLTFMRLAVAVAVQDRASGLAYVSEETITTLTSTLSRFQSTYDQLATRLSERGEEVREKDEALAELERYTRDFVEVLRRRVVRLHQPAEVMNLYGLPQDGSLPKIAAQGEWLTRAAALVTGDAQANSAGYGSMSNPTAAELQGRLQLAQQEMEEVSPADRAYDQAQAAAAALRPDTDALIQEVIDEVRFATRRQDEASQRRILRTYGARFGYLPNETPDPDDPQP